MARRILGGVAVLSRLPGAGRAAARCPVATASSTCSKNSTNTAWMFKKAFDAKMTSLSADEKPKVQGTVVTINVEQNWQHVH